MKTILNQVQWLVFWLAVWLPLALMAADVAAGAPAAGLPAFAPVSRALNFPSTEPEFETLRDAESIDNETITALAQDTRGLIWIGTQKGLVRYDGYRFRKFVHKASDPFSLAGDFVSSLFVAKDGRIWVGTYTDGISVFDPTTERFEHFQHDKKVAGSLSGSKVTAMVGDGRGGMWVATDQGLNYLTNGSVRSGKRSSRRFEHFRHSPDPHSLLDDRVLALLLDKTGRLWVGSRGGLQRLAQDGKHFETVLEGKGVRTLLQAQDGKLWLGTSEHGAAWLDASLVGAQQQAHWLPLAQLSHPAINSISQVNTAQAMVVA
jgi:ligand-binding sensor domain-containing protein